jgi:hypothetical protein
METGDYAYERLRPNSGTSLTDLVESILAAADVHPAVRVRAAGGGRLPGTEVVVFRNGDVVHVAVFRNPQFDDGGWEDHPTLTAPGWAGTIDNSLLEEEADITIEWPTAEHTYDVRGRRDLGAIRTHNARLSPWEPLVFTRSPRPVPRVSAEAPARLRPGGVLELLLRNDAGFPAGFRVVRLDVEMPTGKPYELYARNILFKSEAHTEQIPFASNDPSGRWRARVLDVMTGDSQDLSFEIG